MKASTEEFPLLFKYLSMIILYIIYNKYIGFPNVLFQIQTANFKKFPKKKILVTKIIYIYIKTI
jgi:hypothetical protein